MYWVASAKPITSSSAGRPLKRIARLLAPFVCGSLVACAANVIHTPAESSDTETGIRYYQTSPYLLIYSNSKGGLKWQIIYLPDQTKKMIVSPEIRGGRSELALYFQNGALSGTTEVGDTTALPKALLSAVQSAIPLLAKAAPPTGEPTLVPAPYLYKIVVEGGTIRFYGEQGDTMIRVPAPKEEG